MGSCIGSMVGSCVGSCAMTACCSACSCKCLLPVSVANWLYIGLVMIAAAAALVLRYTGVDLNIGADIGFNGVSVCADTNGTECGNAFSFTICDDNNCKGYWAVYRISFALMSFFFLMMIFTSCTSKAATRIHRGYWFLKSFVIVALLAAMLFAPNDMFAVYAWIARFIAPLFLIYQFIICIDFAYSLNAKLLEKDERMDNFFGLNNEGQKYQCFMLLVSLGLYGGCFTAIGFMYALWNQDCPFNPTAITITLLFGIFNTLVSIIKKFSEHGSILCSSFIFAYSTWLCLSSISAWPEPTCNLFMSDNPDESSADHVGMLITSVCVAGATVGYFAFRMGSRSIGGNAMSGGPSKAPAATEEGAIIQDSSAGHDNVTVDVKGDEKPSTPAEEVEPDTFMTYHIKMVLLSMYMAMLLTDWGVPADSTNSSTVQYGKGYASAWLQMVANWVCCLLYFWSLIAPKCCPDRDFS